MSAFHHYELLCDEPGCAATCNVGEARTDITRRRAAAIGWTARAIPPSGGHQFARYVDLCPDHAASGPTDGPPGAGDALPAVCVDEAPIPVDVLREVRDCLAERVRWFESRCRPVPPATRQAARAVEEAILYAAGAPPNEAP